MARETREVWAKRIERLADSGLTAKEFAAEIGVNANTLAGWRWRLGAKERGRGSPAVLEIVPAPGADKRAPATGEERRPPATTGSEAQPIAPMQFVELTTKLSETLTRPASFEIVLGSGRLVRVPGGFDGAELARLVGVLEEVHS